MTAHPEPADALVIGAGVVGLAVGRALALRGLEVAVVEAAGAIGTGTSSRNSEVIHAGIYYPAGSLKARLCVAGRERLYDYLASRGIAHRRTGKRIVATVPDEVPLLERYLAQARANGVTDLCWQGPAEVAAAEPAIRCAAALLSPSTGILDTHGYLLALQADLERAGGTVVCNSPVQRIVPEGDRFLVETGAGEAVSCRLLVNAAGLGAWAVAKRIEGLPPAAVPPARFARGHYYSLRGPSPFRSLVYPVADSAGLGIHVTLDLAGQARFGPDVQWIDEVDYSFDESRREHFAAAIRRYWPDLDEGRLQPAYTGIRPKLAGPGEPAADFRISTAADHGIPGLVNLFGIESPGLTASLALADEVVARLHA
jgi:L-2-hydroxyglutarate oxidase LhgO